jgi:hypothetical protein
VRITPNQDFYTAFFTPNQDFLWVTFTPNQDFLWVTFTPNQDFLTILHKKQVEKAKNMKSPEIARKTESGS